eukprot:jgi/Botrbrau1/18736/Bobra.0386s0059.1
MISAAHTAKAAGLIQEAYHGFFNLAEDFVVNSLHALAQTYYRECFVLAKKEGWSEGQLNANLNIGLISQHLKNWAAAEESFRLHLDLAQGANNDNEIQVAYTNLVQVLWGKAKELEEEENFYARIQVLRKCLLATAAGHLEEEGGRTKILLGLALHQQGQFDEACEVLASCQFLGPSQQGDLTSEIITGACALADSYYRKKLADDAIMTLTRVVTRTQVSADLHGEAQARCHLGVIHFQEGNMEHAMTEFEKQLALAQQLDDKRILHIAMVNMAGVLADLEEQSRSGIPKIQTSPLQ